MGLMDTAKAAIKRITSDLNGFARSLSFVSGDGLSTATISGLHSKIHMATDTEGNNVNSKKAYVSFSESLLTDVGYPTRDANNEFAMKGHLVTVIDSTGNSVQYVIREIFPDEAVGLMVCILGDYQ